MTLTPVAFTSSATVFVNPSTPHLLTAYAPHSGAARLPAPLEILTTNPLRCGIMILNAARVHRNTLRRLADIVATHSSTVTSIIRLRGVSKQADLKNTSR